MKLFLAFISSFFVLIGFTQQKLNGIYKIDVELIAEFAEIYRFYDDGTFVHQYWDDVGDQIGIGKYELDKTQITLHYQTINSEFKKMKIIEQNSMDSLSRLFVLNPIIRNEKLKITYQILSDTGLVSTKTANADGFTTFKLAPDQTLNAYVESLNIPMDFKTYAYFTLPATTLTKDYLVYPQFYPNHTIFLPEKTIQYPIKIKKKLFRIKVNNKWVWYDKWCE